LEIIDRNGIPWLRGSQIDTALGYSGNKGGTQTDTPFGVKKLYSRHKDEFTEEMTTLLNLPTPGGVQPVRVFNPRGCWLLGMFAKTAKAKDFRRWVLDVLEERSESSSGKHVLKWNDRSTISGHEQMKLCSICGAMMGHKPHMDSSLFKMIKYCTLCGSAVILMAECYLEIPIDYECPDNTIDIDTIFS